MASLVACSSSRRAFLGSISRSIAATSTPTHTRAFRANREPTYKSLQDEIDMDDLPEFQGDDTTAVGHLILRQQRETFNLLRLIETEIPALEQYRRPFQPPTKDHVVCHRQLWYGGEQHPATKKAVIVVPVSRLPLNTSFGIHKFKLLAGPRWTYEPPKDAGFSAEETDILKSAEHGFVKISCEDMPEHIMNLKWCTDTLDSMVAEANNEADTFGDVPLDERHMHARDRKHRSGRHTVRRADRATIFDFPQRWLPQAPSQPAIADA